MKLDFNKAILCGNLATDLELKSSASGTSVCGFSLAVQRFQKKADGTRETQFHRVVTFGKTAEYLVQNAHKGDVLLVSGEITYNKFTDKNGIERQITEILADTAKIAYNGTSSEGGNYADNTHSVKPVQSSQAVEGNPPIGFVPQKPIPSWTPLSQDEDLPF